MSTYNAAAAKFLDPYYVQKAAAAAPYKLKWEKFITETRREIWLANMRYEHVEMPPDLHESFLHDMYPHDGQRFINNFHDALEAGFNRSFFKRRAFANLLNDWTKLSLPTLRALLADAELWQSGTVTRWRATDFQMSETLTQKIFDGVRKSQVDAQLISKNLDYIARLLLLTPEDCGKLRDDREALKNVEQLQKTMPAWLDGYRQVLDVTA